MSRRSLHVLTAVALAGVLAACASMMPVPAPLATMSTAAVAAEYEPYQKPGTASLAGQAFLTQRGGGVVKAAGRTVTLDPWTSYAREWLGKFGMSLERFGDVPPDTLFQAARRTTTADADGRFRFANLPAGTYVVRTTVTWEVPTGRTYIAPTEVQGGVVADTVALKEGEHREVILTR